MQEQKLSCYQCEDEECDLSEHQTPLVCEYAVMCWKSTAREAGAKETISRGCISSPDQVPLYCNMHLHSSDRVGNFHIQCCQENLCNGGPFPLLPYRTTDADITNTIQLIILMLGPLVGLFLIICGVYVYHRKNRTKNGSTAPLKSNNLVESGTESAIPTISSALASGGNIKSREVRVTACSEITIKELMQGRSLSSGSGSGLPILVHRTLSQHVTLVEHVSSNGASYGKFGPQIWRGILHGENVAVKIRYSRDIANWTRETEVYANLLPSRHENIIGYIGSDMTSRASCTQLWIVTHYHKPGSLSHYLRKLPQPLNHHQLIDICWSIVNGILYLHTEIQGTQGKPAMAHRNLSSKNIIVKADGTCVIADLSHVITQDGLATDKMNFRQIPKRYMSPELLEMTLDQESLESFLMADIYSLGLIFWEVCRCCVSNGESLSYAAAYSEWMENVDQEPTLEEMKKLVITDKLRPTIPNHWHSDPILTRMEAMMTECWRLKALARLPILRIKKNLDKIVENNSDNNE